MTGYPFDTIFTLDARSNIFLEVTAAHHSLVDAEVFDLIQTQFRMTTEILASKKIQYGQLRRALVPSIEFHERALVFDYTRFNSALYGREVIHALLPVLRRDATHSVLAGDWVGDGLFGDWLEMSPPARGTVRVGRPACRYDTTYFVYLNGLSPQDTDLLEAAFEQHPAYLGMLDLDRSTPLKTYLSTCLVRDFIKHRQVVIKGHEDDRDPSEDYNLSPFDFERFGCTVRSLPLLLYDLFLSYKIEALMPLADGFDRKFALNAMTDAPRPLDDFQVLLEEPKLRYLREHKAGSLKRMGFAESTAEQIASQIRAKVDSSYIYELARSSNGKTLKFTVLVEAVDGERAQCALEYQIADARLRVITFY